MTHCQGMNLEWVLVRKMRRVQAIYNNTISTLDLIGLVRPPHVFDSPRGHAIDTVIYSSAPRPPLSSTMADPQSPCSTKAMALAPGIYKIVNNKTGVAVDLSGWDSKSIIGI